nr:nuclear transport factor 2 family protein [Shewanella corallii]
MVSRFYTSLEAKDMSRFLDTMHDNVQLDLSGVTPLSGHIDGKDTLCNQVFPLLMEQLADDFQFCTKWKVMCSNGEMAVAIMEARGNTKSGKNYDQRYCHIFRVTEGRISRLWEFYDSELVRNSLFDGENELTPLFPPFEF